jgi:alkanesulfonate monooxygenase SsuD/methylene tetrahydromethanopterin reductase-like flavin-dependent oxidoreductase (luciferase family)
MSTPRQSLPRQIKLGMFLRPAGHHVAGWRYPDAWADGGLNFPKYVETARTAERGLFDLLFSADALTGERYDRETLSRTSYVAWIEPMSLLTALAAVTENIGLVCTATTTYDEPYHTARRFASLDLISGGRSG